MLSLLFGSGGVREGQAIGKSPSFSLPRLKNLYTTLISFRESDLDRPGGSDVVVETVRQITEALVWGEQHDEDFFNFFCEKGIFADFINVLAIKRAPKGVKVQLLQSLSMLLQNIRKQHSLYYLLSNRQVNRLISQPLDLCDEEILAYYITLLKSLAMRLDGETIKFFFEQEQPAEHRFPLYTQATKLFDHKDQMVRASVRTITLRVYPIDFEPMRAFVQKHAEDSYFSRLAMHLRDIWLRLNKAAVLQEDPAGLQHANDLQQDLLIYLADVFELGIERLNQVLAERLMEATLVPLLLVSIDDSSGPQASAGRSIQTCQRLAPTVALFLLRHVIDTIKSPALLEPLCAAVLHNRAPEELLRSLSMEGRQFHEHFVRFLRGPDDAAFVFAAAVVHGCVRNRQLLSADFLERARIFPATGSSGARRAAPLAGEQQRRLDVPHYLLQALRRHVAWRAETFQVLVLVVLDLFTDPALAEHPEGRAAAMAAAREAFAAAGQQLRGLLRERLQMSGDRGWSPVADDSLLDVFMEEWEHHRCPLPTVAEACTNACQLLLSPAGGSSARGRGVAPPPPGGPQRAAAAPAPEEGARRAVRAFLLLRRLLEQLANGAQDVGPQERPAAASAPPRPGAPPPPRQIQPQPQRWTPTDEPSPLQAPPEQALGNFHEGLPVPLSPDGNRIICTITVKGASHTRYLILEEAWLLLAKIDPSRPGQGLVTTKWPMQQVHSTIDRGDPRVLQIGMQALLGDVSPGEASQFSPPVSLPADGAGQRRGPFFTLAMGFEDVRRCHTADLHLQASRQKVRSALLQQALRYVEESSGRGPSPSVGL